MSETKDPAIKLFGKTIPLPDVTAASGNSTPGAPSTTTSAAADVVVVDEDQNDHEHPSSTISSPENGDEEEREVDKDTLGRKVIETKEKDGTPPQALGDVVGQDATSGIIENHKITSTDNETATLKTAKNEEEQSETTGSQEKTLKKPDKILPCPRCNSMDTKFCYYNNYNVNQPRHFCKNCQRYWTAGGSMRNVPVGAGRRKNKHSASQFRHISVSEALQSVRSDGPNGVHHTTLKPNGTVLSFGSDTPLCESMASALSIAETTMQNSIRNGFHKPEELRIPVSYISGENGDSHFSGLSATVQNSKEEVGKPGVPEPAMQNCQGFPTQIPFFPGAPWPYPWNAAQWSSPVPPPAFCPPGFPMPFYPAPNYWGCAVPGAWNIPWLPQPPSPNPTVLSSGSNSPTLGKHSRDEDVIKPSDPAEEGPVKENNSDRCLWIPKTLRIDDPGEAARSSIWQTLGIKNDNTDSFNGGGLFKAFQSKENEKNHISETSSMLHANPAALSRSLKFQETS